MLEQFKTGDWYHYRKLPPQEKKIYMHIYNAVLGHRNDVTFPVEKHNGVYPTADRIIDIMLHVVWDNPKFYYFDATNVTYRYKTKQNPATFQLMYTDYFPVRSRPQIEQALRMRADEILSMAYDTVEGYPQLYTIYHYLVRKVWYMDSIQRTNTLKNLEARTIIGPLLNHLGVCAGYTKTFKLLCDQLGIPCFYIRGQALTDSGWRNHGWNVVYLNGSFYHVDITFDSNEFHTTGNFSCTYYLRGDAFLSKNHRWDRSHFPVMPKDYR